MTTNLPPSKPPAEVHPMQALLEQGGYDMPQRGDIREGTVLSVGPQEVIIDLGLKREGIVPANDLSRLDKDTLAEVREGTTWPVYILQTADREGNLIVSLSRAQQEKDWLDAQKKMESNEIFEAQVTGFNSGGLEVAFGKLRGFVPASHISTLPRNASEEERKERLAGFVGRTVPVKVVEVDRRRRRLIMSERAAHRRWQREHRKQLLDDLAVGDVRTGIVRSLADFGVFVDLGGADGLVHISELAWFPVTHPSEVVKVGQEVEVKVLRVDKSRERIGLSIKRVLPDPWSRVEEDYHVGELVEAVVTRVVDFGAFVRLRTGVEGLLHVTEMADITPDHPQSLVSPGDLLLLRVLRIEPDRRRVGLSLRQVSESEWAEWAAQYHQKAAAAAEGEAAAAGEEYVSPADVEAAPVADEGWEEETAEEAAAAPEEAVATPAEDVVAADEVAVVEDETTVAEDEAVVTEDESAVAEDETAVAEDEAAEPDAGEAQPEDLAAETADPAVDAPVDEEGKQA
jgi:small subunit ribosomal protein S1